MTSKVNVKDPKSLASYIEQTLLKPEATHSDIEKLCEEAIQHRFLGICVNSKYVSFAKEKLKDSSVLLVSVVGFPLGAVTSQVKFYETSQAIADGADEIDMVLDIASVKEARFASVTSDIAEVVKAADKRPVKVILETGLLTDQEIAESCQAATRGGAAFVKTSTGFLGRGASLKDIAIMQSNISAQMGIKASGGVKSSQFAFELLQAGAARLGTSSGVALIQNQVVKSGY